MKKCSQKLLSHPGGLGSPISPPRKYYGPTKHFLSTQKKRIAFNKVLDCEKPFISCRRPNVEVLRPHSGCCFSDDNACGPPRLDGPGQIRRGCSLVLPAPLLCGAPHPPDQGWDGRGLEMTQTSPH